MVAQVAIEVFEILMNRALTLTNLAPHVVGRILWNAPFGRLVEIEVAFRISFGDFINASEPMANPLPPDEDRRFNFKG